MNQEKFWKFSKLKPLENRIHENIKTLLDQRKIQKKKKKSVTEYLYHCSTECSNVAGYVWLKKAKILIWIYPRTFKSCLVPVFPIFYNVEVSENVNEIEVREPKHEETKRRHEVIESKNYSGWKDQVAPEHLWGRKLHNLSGLPVPTPECPETGNLSSFKLCLLCLVFPVCASVKSLTTFSW